MTNIDSAAVAAREDARQGNGQFGAQEHTAPEAELNLRVELDNANQAYWDNTDRIREEVKLYLIHGMPEGAELVEFEGNDEGTAVYAARAFDANGDSLDLDDDYDRWQDVNDVVSWLGYPDDNRSTFQELLPSANGRVFTWNRTQPSNDADEQAIRERIDKLADVRRDLAGESQAGAILAIRRMLPEGSHVVLTWGDQGGPEYLSAEKVVLADGTELDYDTATDAGIAFDEIDLAASDIRDAHDLSLTPLDDQGAYFSLAPKETPA